MEHLEELELAEWRKTPSFRAQLVEALYQKARAKKTSYLFVPLADAYALSGENDNAIAVLRGGLSKHPGSRAGQVLLAQLLYDQGEEEEARRYLEGVVAKWPDNPAAVILLAKILSRQGEHHRAAAITARLVAWYPDSRFIVKTAEQFARLAEEEANRERVDAVTPAQPEPKPKPVVDETRPVVRKRPAPKPKAARKKEPPLPSTPPERPLSPAPQLFLTPAMLDTGPVDDENETPVDPMELSTVFLPEPAPKLLPSTPSRRPSKKKTPDGQIALFKLESMLDSISRLKGEREKD